MFLLIDGQAIQSPGSGQRGIGRYSRSLVRAIASARPEWRIELVQNGRGLPLDSKDLGGLPVVTYMPPTSQRVEPPLVVDELAVNEIHYADWLTAQGADAVLLTSMIACEMEAVVPRFGHSRPAIYAVLYDLIPLLYSDRYLQAEWQRDYYAQRMQQMSAVDALFAISQTSADDFASHFPDAKPKLINIRGAVDRDMALLSEKELSTIATKLRSKINISGDFILYVGGPDWRKNVEGTIRSFANLSLHLRKANPLVIAGHLVPSDQERYERLASELDISDHIRFSGYVSHDELRALYQSCRLFFFPSLYEGLGLPILEALHFGAPVVTSNTSSLPEYAGDVCWLADPEDHRSMGRALKIALSEPYHKRYDERRRFARSFKWSDSAELVCSQIETKDHAELSAPKVAWVTSVEKIARGAYDLDLLRALGERCNLVIAVDHLESVPGELATHVRTVSWTEMLTQPATYDQIIYDASDSRVPKELQSIIARHSGLMILDDPATIAIDVHSSGVRQLLQMISGLIVPSTESANRLRDTLNVPISVIPMAFVDPSPTTMAHHRLKLGKSLGRTLVGTQVTSVDVEFFEKLCTAVMKLPERFRTHFELIVLDYATPDTSYRMHMLAQSAGLPHCHFLPKMGSAVAHEYIAACDFWVPSNNGPASRMAMLRAMALGTACLAPGATPSDNPDSVVRQMRAIPWHMNELASTLQLHAEQPHLRKVIARAGLTHIQQRHGMKQCANAWCDLIDRSVKRRIEAYRPWQESVIQALVQLPAEHAFDDLETWSEMHLDAVRSRSARIPQMLKPPAARSIERLPVHLPPRPLHSMMSAPRRIWIDVSYIATVHNGRFTGICRTVVSVLKEMIARPELPLNFCVYQEQPTPHFRPIDRDQIENLLTNGSWVNGGENIRGVIDEQEVEFWEDDVLFLPELNVTPPYCQLLRDLKATLDLRIVPVVYDIICCREPQLFGPHGIPHFWNWAVCLIETAEVILSISEYTKKDLQWLAEVNQLPEPNIEVFRLGDSDLYQTAGGASSVGGLTRDDPFVLMVSTIEVRKNHQLTYHTWRRLIEKHGAANVPKLVYVGSPGWLTENFGDLIRSDPTIRDHILWMSNLGDDGLGWLYRNCLFTLYPSHYEGWGLPIGESLSFGKYCIGSMSSSIPEIGGPLVDYHDPNDLLGFEQLVERAIFDEEYRKARERLIRMEYRPTTWTACAAEIVDIWEANLGYFDAFTEEPWPQSEDAKRWAS